MVKSVFMGTQVAKFTVQKVIMFDAETAAMIRKRARELGASESQVIRQLVAAGSVANFRARKRLSAAHGQLAEGSE